MPHALPPGAKKRAAEVRCAAMIHHAREQILVDGLQRFSLNEVLRLSGGSKATLTKYFGGRMGLVAAAIEAEAREAMGALALVGVAGAADAEGPLGDSLTGVLTGILRFYLTPGALAIYRTVIAAADLDPEMARAFYLQGHAVMRDTLAAFLEARKGRAVDSMLDCADVADRLLHAIRAGLYEKALLNLVAVPASDEEIGAHVARTVAVMLPGIQPSA